MVNKKQNNTQWWKILIVLTFLISLIILSILILDVYDKEVVKSKRINAKSINSAIDRNSIITSHCVNAELYYPIIDKDEAWVFVQDWDKKSYCIIIYRDIVKGIRFGGSS